jgi:glucose/arabinose dehydrogenase
LVTEPTAAISCVGDCRDSQAVAVTDVIMLVNIVLGSVDVSACEHGVPPGVPVTVVVIIEAVNNALSGCPMPVVTETPTVTVTATQTVPVASPTAIASPTETAAPTPPPATPTATLVPTAPAHFCDLPGSVHTTANGLVIVPGGPANAPDLSFLHLPVGFCAHFFAHIGNTRQLRFAPGGELFVASPTTGTTGGGAGGRAAIVALPDDDHDGVADTPITFLSGLPSTQGLLFANGSLYYQDGTKIMRLPYATGDRMPSGNSEEVAKITIYSSSVHWPKTLDMADNGTIYVGNGGDQGEPCNPLHPFHGGILKLDGTPGGTPVVKGFRNPISVRCPHGHNLCLAIELARDFTDAQGGREKLAPIHEGDDWGFPCCATKDLPFPDVRPVPDCSAVVSETGSFIVGHTPFDLDFETGKWPAPWSNRVYVPLHGVFGTWQGASVVTIGMDPTTGQLLPGSELGGHPTGAFSVFATGWDDGTHLHGRPAAVAFAPDGRLFLGNDNSGDILWIAPLDL